LLFILHTIINQKIILIGFDIKKIRTFSITTKLKKENQETKIEKPKKINITYSCS